MAVDQLAGHVREFANYLDGLLARLDQDGGWCGVFWRRDPDGMRACLAGREVPPWDVVEALLHDLAAGYGAATADAEREGARALHTAAVAAHDARPGARDELGGRLDVMLREQRYATERQAELSRLLASATTREEADALRIDLAWARDDHERATARCAELRARMADLDRRTASDVRRAPDGDALRAGDGAPQGRGETVSDAVSAGHRTAPVWAAADALPADAAGAGPSTDRQAPDTAGDGGHSTPGRPASDGFRRQNTANDFLSEYRLRPRPSRTPDDASHAHSSSGFPDGASRAHSSSGFPDGASRVHSSSGVASGFPDGASRVHSSSGVASGFPDGASRAHPPSGPVPETPEDTRWAPARGGSLGADPGPDTAFHAFRRPAQVPAADHVDPVPSEPARAPEPAPAPAGERKRRRGGARFAGTAGDGTARTVVPQAPVPPLAADPTPAPAPRRTPRGARFAGAATEEARRPQPQAGTTEPQAGATPDAEAGRAVAGVVESLVRLRAEGRSGEAHALLVEAASWPAPRFPLLAEELERAGLGADWTTFLWEAASMPADRLVAAADALEAAGRSADGRHILRQGVARPAAEIGEAVLALDARGREREVRALLDACVRVRTPEEAARSVAVAPQRLVPLLLEAARGVSQERHWDVLHAVRVAGFTV